MIKIFGRLTDDELIEYTLDGEKKAYSVLVRRYQQAVLGLARHLLGNLEDAEDIAFVRTQTIFFFSIEPQIL